MNRSKKLMEMFGLRASTGQLAMKNNVHLEWPCAENVGWSCLEKSSNVSGMRSEQEREAESIEKKTLRRKVECEHMKASLRMEDGLH